MTSAFLLAAAAALPFAGLDRVLPSLGPIEAVPYSWAEYLVRSREGEARVRITLLPGPAEARYWLEVAAAGSGGVVAAARMLLRGTSLEAGDVERIELMLAGQQPIAVPVAPETAPRGARGRPSGVRRLGRGRVRVRAGAFDAEEVSIAGARVWRAAGVPLWGMVEARTATRSIELLGCGASGGHSVFPGERAQGNGGESAR
jgi:hypothetical protein